MADLFTAEDLKILEVRDAVDLAKGHLSVFEARTRLISPIEFAQTAVKNSLYFRPDQDYMQFVMEVYHPLKNTAGRVEYYMECMIIFDVPYEYFGMKNRKDGIPSPAVQKQVMEPCKQAGLLLLKPMMAAAITKLNDGDYPKSGKMGWTQQARAHWKKLVG